MLHTPISAFGGERTTKRMRVRSWNGESIRTMILTTGYFREDIFYLRDCEDEVISEVMRLL